MGKVLFYIESPLQLINSYEAVNYFNINEYVLIIRLNSIKRNNEQLFSLSNEFFNKEIKFIKINSKNKNLSDIFKIVYIKLFLYRKKFEKVFIGNIESPLFKIIFKKYKNNNMFLLDDGNKTLIFQKKFTKNDYFNLFTFYPLQTIGNQVIYYNNLTFFNKKISQYKIKDKVLFLGSDLVDLEIFSIDQYIDKLFYIKKYFFGKEFIYIPHRNESDDHINQIKKIVKIQKIDYPVELYGLYNQEIPLEISSFYSTALFTMKKLYKDAHISAFKTDFSHTKYYNAISEVYDFYEKHMEVILIDD